MAEIVKAAPQDLSTTVLTIKEFDELGRTTEYSVPMPTSGNFNEWSIVQQIGMLKMGTWKKVPIHQIMFAIAYANRYALDIMQGDVYSTGEGRIGISNKAKIKLALATGNVKGIKTAIRDTGAPISLTGCAQKTDLECTATITVKGWDEPIVLTQRLSEWFMERNPNWVGRPAHMLTLNTVAHACEFINPGETGDDEAPPLAIAAPATSRDSTVVEAQFTTKE